MARVNVEESALVAVKRISKDTGLDRKLILASLVELWHDSQALEQEIGTKADILAWLDLDLSKEQESSLLSAMEQTHLLEPIGDSVWVIVGNAKHISNLRQRKDAAAAGGKASGSTRSKRTLEANGSTERLNRNDDSVEASGEARTEQSSTDQGNTEQSRADLAKASVELSGAIPDLAGDPEVEEFLELVSKSAQRRWIKLYGEPAFITQEILRAVAWLEDNPQKRPKKKMATFMGSWLARGWERHRKTLPTNQGTFDIRAHLDGGAA